MNALDNLFDASCFGLPQKQKEDLFLPALNALTKHHHENCEKYHSLMIGYGISPGEAESLEELPFLAVRLFKRFDMKSIPDNAVFKTLTSSGTTGQTPSRIFLDAATAQIQSRSLVKVIQSFIGEKRLPMLILDHPSVVKDRRNFSARGAGILGLSTFGRDYFYALDDETMELRFGALEAWLEKYKGAEILIFGFTFMVWKYFVSALKKSGRKLNLGNAVLIHSGGWKKLQDEAVNNTEFRQTMNEWTGVSRVHNFYGMVEQTGSIYVECADGHLHAPVLSDVIIRDPKDWSVLPYGQEGVIQVISSLPLSYPGHSLLTEDLGTLLGVDDCPCGRRGKYFKVAGRVPMAEMRGCSDTHANSSSRI
jgi:Acyl-protein synthetase, LuxE